MLPYRDSRLMRIFLAIFFLIVVGYAYYEIRGLLYGPRIHVPEGVTQSSEQFISIKGKVERIATLTMNGAPISVTETGEFEEPYLLSPGLNRIVFDAEDKYGRTQQEVLQIVYTPAQGSEPPSIAPPATSTSATTSEEVIP